MYIYAKLVARNGKCGDIDLCVGHCIEERLGTREHRCSCGKDIIHNNDITTTKMAGARNFEQRLYVAPPLAAVDLDLRSVVTYSMDASSRALDTHGVCYTLGDILSLIIASEELSTRMERNGNHKVNIGVDR